MRILTFAERQGIIPPKPLQNDGMDADLRTGLWNAIQFARNNLRRAGDYYSNPEGTMMKRIWVYFLKMPIDEFETAAFWVLFSRWFFDDGVPWHQIYECIQFFARNLDAGLYDDFRTSVNRFLEIENAGFRLIGFHISPLTNDEEIFEVATARLTASPLVSSHLEQAMEHLSDKTNPDYSNSVKESISAVECWCKILCKPYGMQGATLGQLLDKLTKELDLSDHLRDGFKCIYKYTSDEHGIRHAKKDDKVAEQEDARFMLVACSALVNLLTEKARKQGNLPM